MAEGTCEILIQAEKVKAKCKVCVKPDMKAILLPKKQVTLSMGQKIGFVPDYEPKNCFDSRIFIAVNNPEIVIFENGQLVSKGLISIFLLMSNKAFGMIAVVLGALMGVRAVMQDYENVDGMVNVRGEAMQADCVGSILFILLNIAIGIFAIMG